MVLVLLMTCCAEQESDERQRPDPLVESYRVRGLVRGLDFAASSVIVEHEDIPGLMPSMTMPFHVKEIIELQKLHEGTAIAFELVMAENESWITDITPIDRSTLQLPEKPAISDPDAPVERVREGDPAPSFELVDQDGEAVRLEDYQGEQLVVTFVFTRCPVPDYCPLMSENFRQLQDEIEHSPQLRDTAHLLSVTIDPAFDTPEVLKAYAARFEAAPDRWKFATGSADEINRLTRAFSVYTSDESGTIDHGLCTALIDAHGIVKRIWRGNRWQPAEILEVLQDGNESASDDES